jgi:hypothetical protein
MRDTPAAVQFTLGSPEFRGGAQHLQAHAVLDRTVYPVLPPAAGVSRLVH